MFSNISFWQSTSEMASNKKEKVSRKNIKELRGRRSKNSKNFPEKCPCNS